MEAGGKGEVQAGPILPAERAADPVPPLRERKDDILFILEHLKLKMGVDLAMTAETAALLVAYPWHGNVRELKNCVEYLAYLDKRTIEARTWRRS